MSLIYASPLPKQFSDIPTADGLKWIHALPYGEWDHPRYGMTYVDEAKVDNFIRNFNSGVVGIDISTDFEHGLDPTKGLISSGEIKAMRKQSNGLWIGVEPTERARQEVDAGEWKYFSTEFWEEWEDPHTGEKFTDVITGGGYTNKPWIKRLNKVGTELPLNFSELVVEKEEVVAEEATAPTAEVVEKEHSEPGSGGGGAEPEPRPTGDNAPGEQGTRGDDPLPEDEQVSASFEQELRELLEIDGDADIITTVREMKAEVTPFREVAKQHSDRKAFSELYPAEAKRLSELERESRNNRAKSFSESYANVVVDGTPTGKGFSSLVLNELEELHKKFSDGSVNINDVKDVLDKIGKTGLVDYTEKGTKYVDGDIVTGESDAPRMFAEKVVDIMEKDEVDHAKATNIAAQRHPQLFEAYQNSYRQVRA